MRYGLSCGKHWLMAALVITFIPVTDGYSRPNMSPLGPNIAEKGSTFYHFTVNNFNSADGKRHYRVWTGIPDKAPPVAGYPVLYMLDGNAVMDRLSDGLLETASEHNPAVLIVTGYQTDKPFDLEARSYDYTPLVLEDGEECNKQAIRGRACGGSTIFRQMLETEIAPQAERGLKINPAQRGIWGHSFGGLFVLDSWLNSSFFKAYYATSPSLNSDWSGLLNQLKTVNRQFVCDKQLYLADGDGAPEPNPLTPAVKSHNKILVTLSLLRREGLSVTHWSYPQRTHGEMFNIGFQQALLDISANGAGKNKASCSRVTPAPAKSS